ncbi:hypothetical protein [Longispora albida]|uniref:hypothetical protein n=1 Tax=Longispora albida TaxID=203523 RepID=UPI0003708224|nr:hypothetical protein [Longispora albida]
MLESSRARIESVRQSLLNRIDGADTKDPAEIRVLAEAFHLVAGGIAPPSDHTLRR